MTDSFFVRTTCDKDAVQTKIPSFLKKRSLNLYCASCTNIVRPSTVCLCFIKVTFIVTYKVYFTNLSKITSIKIIRDIFKNHDPSLSSCFPWKVQCTIYNQFYNSMAKNRYQTQTVFTQLRSIIEFLKLFSSKTLKVDVLYRCRKLSILKENNWPIEKRRIISMVNNELTWYRFERKWSDSARVAKGSQRVGTGRGTRIVAGARDHRRAES